MDQDKARTLAQRVSDELGRAIRALGRGEVSAVRGHLQNGQRSLTELLEELNSG